LWRIFLTLWPSRQFNWAKIRKLADVASVVGLQQLRLSGTDRPQRLISINIRQPICLMLLAC
jgi:hypothetical protein